MNPSWQWDFEWLLNLSTVIALGASSGYVAHCIWRRNRAGHRDRLVWGLMAFFCAILILSGYTAIANVGLLPDWDFVRILVRLCGIGAALTLARAVKTAEPLVYLTEMRSLNQRILNKRALINKQDHDLIVAHKRIEAYERVFGPLPD